MNTDSWLPALITGLFGLLSGVGLTYLSAVLKFRKDLEKRYDQDLHQPRLQAYIELWKRLEPLTRHAPPKQFTPQTLRDLLVSLRQ